MKKQLMAFAAAFLGGAAAMMPLASSAAASSAKPRVEVVSAQMRETDPTVMDVKYRVYSTAGNDTVNVRALAFQDGVRSFANVVRPAKFLEG